MQGVPRHGEREEHPDPCKALFGLSMVSFSAISATFAYLQPHVVHAGRGLANLEGH